MPNYSLESEGHYNPYAYKEFQDSIDAVLKQQDEIDDAYAELKQNAFTIGSLIDPNDTDAYNMYQTYMNMLNNGIDSLISHGLNYNSRRQMQDIKSLYNRYMTPIANAYAARAAEIKSQQDAYNADNSIRYEREAAATNLSDYLRNPNLHARSASGKNIMANVSAMLQNVALGAMHGDENSQGILQRMFGNNIDYAYVYQHGFDLNIIADAIANIDDPKYAALKQMVVQAEKDEGFDEWADQNIKDYMRNWALSGLAAAIGRTETSERRNTQAYLNAELDMQERLYDYTHPDPDLTKTQIPEEILKVWPLDTEESSAIKVEGTSTKILDNRTEARSLVASDRIPVFTIDSKSYNKVTSKLASHGTLTVLTKDSSTGKYKAGKTQKVNLDSDSIKNIKIKPIADKFLNESVPRYSQQGDAGVVAVTITPNNGDQVTYLVPYDMASTGINTILGGLSKLQGAQDFFNSVTTPEGYSTYKNNIALSSMEMHQGVVQMLNTVNNKTEAETGLEILE